MDQLLDDDFIDEQLQTPKGKVFTEVSIIISTLIAGPVVAGYMIAQNFKTFGAPSKRLPTLLIAVGYTVAIFLSNAHLLIHLKLPNIVFSVLNTVVVWVFFGIYQSQMVKNHIYLGGKKQKWPHIAAAIIITLLLFVSAALSYYYYILGYNVLN
ncbi:MAG: hypothetical protein ACPGLV_11645 [Bacteroidia bacterium]